jgi:peroxiredoxin
VISSALHLKSPLLWIAAAVSLTCNQSNTQCEEASCMLKVGDEAPDFTLLTHEGQPLTLSSLRGHKVLLWFYPKADTPG